MFDTSCSTGAPHPTKCRLVDDNGKDLFPSGTPVLPRVYNKPMVVLRDEWDNPFTQVASEPLKVGVRVLGMSEANLPAAKEATKETVSGNICIMRSVLSC